MFIPIRNNTTSIATLARTGRRAFKVKPSGRNGKCRTQAIKQARTFKAETQALIERLANTMAITIEDASRYF